MPRQAKPDSKLPTRCQDMRRLRKRAGASRVEWSKLLEVSMHSIYGWECGKQIPGNSILKLARTIVLAKEDGYELRTSS